MKKALVFLFIVSVALIGSAPAWGDHPKPDPNPTHGNDCTNHNQGNLEGNEDHCEPPATVTTVHKCYSEDEVVPCPTSTTTTTRPPTTTTTRPPTTTTSTTRPPTTTTTRPPSTTSTTVPSSSTTTTTNTSSTTSSTVLVTPTTASTPVTTSTTAAGNTKPLSPAVVPATKAHAPTVKVLPHTGTATDLLLILALFLLGSGLALLGLEWHLKRKVGR